MIEQLAHAALCLGCIEHSSSDQTTDTNAAFVFPGAVNRRSQLLPEYHGRLAYPGYCITLTPIVIPVSKLMDVNQKHRSLRNGDDGARQAALLEVADMIKAEYEEQKNSENLMAVTPQLLELMMASMPVGEQ